jgi:hypothetical protein
MPYAAITYRVKPGHEDEIAAIFDGFQRVDTPTLPGEQAGDDILVRVIHYDGDFAAVGRHMAAQKGVHLLEQQLAPYLAEQRDTRSTEDFGAYFRDATMRSIAQLTVDTHPAGR